ncbi:MAG: hypothetical protein ACOVP2_10405 [Armatimonadaceae bacterium]
MRWLLQNERTLRMVYSAISGAIGKSGWNPWGILINWYRWSVYAAIQRLPSRSLAPFVASWIQTI